MILKQLSVFLENKEGRMLVVTQILKDNGIDIKTLSLADTSEFGMLRLIVSDPEKAKTVLKEAGFPVSITEVLAVTASDRVGYLHDLLKAIEGETENIEYMYTLPTEKDPVIILKVSNPQKLDSALSAKGL